MSDQMNCGDGAANLSDAEKELRRVIALMEQKARTLHEAIAVAKRALAHFEQFEAAAAEASGTSQRYERASEQELRDAAETICATAGRFRRERGVVLALLKEAGAKAAEALSGLTPPDDQAPAG